MKSAASLETPGMRRGAVAPTMPAASRLPCETPFVVSSAGKPEGPVTSARPGQGPQRRSPCEGIRA
jgi:hypothetical protein